MALHTMMSMHNVSNMRVGTWYPGNSNCLTFEIESDGETVRLNVFGLGDDRADSIVRVMGDEATRVYADGVHVPLAEFITVKDTYRKLEEINGK